VREDLHTRLTKAQRDARALHAGYRALRHRFEVRRCSLTLSNPR